MPKRVIYNTITGEITRVAMSKRAALAELQADASADEAFLEVADDEDVNDVDYYVDVGGSGDLQAF